MSARRLWATMAGRSAAIRLSPRALASVASSASAVGSAESHVPLRRVGLAKGLGLRVRPPGVPPSTRRVERVRPPTSAVGESGVGSASRGTEKRPLDAAEGERACVPCRFAEARGGEGSAQLLAQPLHPPLAEQQVEPAQLPQAVSRAWPHHQATPHPEPLPTLTGEPLLLADGEQSEPLSDIALNDATRTATCPLLLPAAAAFSAWPASRGEPKPRGASTAWSLLLRWLCCCFCC